MRVVCVTPLLQVPMDIVKQRMQVQARNPLFLMEPLLLTHTAPATE
jgi:hypothetical protein